MLFLSMLFACAPSQEKFEEESWNIGCDLLFECVSEDDRNSMGPFWVFGDTVDECYTLDEESSEEDTATETSDCDYNKTLAKECLDELELLTCDDFADFSYDIPDPCEKVCDGE